MKINVKLMRQEVFSTLQSNYKKLFSMIKDNPTDSSWLADFCGTTDIFEEKKYTIENFVLKDSNNYKDVEVENGIILYERLHKLPRYILCTMRFWVWIIFEKAYHQAQVAMDFTPSVIRNFWFENDNRRGLMLNVMARQYFKVELSIDETLKDKYELTNYLFNCHTIYKNFAYRNICMLPNVSRAILKSSYYFYRKYNVHQTENTISSFVKHVTRIGSTKLVDIIPEDELFLYLCTKMKPVIKEEINGK